MVTCHPEGVTGIGAIPANIMIVGIAPGKDEFTRSKKPFTGPSGKLLDGLLKFIGLSREDVFATNLYCQWNDSPTPEEIDGCFERFLKEYKAVKPKVILCLGKIVTEYLIRPPFVKDWKTLRNKAYFSKIQGGVFWSDVLKCWLISTYHPAAYLSRGGKPPVAEIHDGVRDFRKIAIYLNADKDYGKFQVESAQDAEHAQRIVNHYVDHYGNPDPVAIDVETYYKGDGSGCEPGMMSIAFSCEHGTFHIGKELVNIPDYTVLPIDGVPWTFHNGMFDTQKIKQYLHVNLPIKEDTMLQSYSLDERGGGDKESDSFGFDRQVGIHGLKRLSMEYEGAECYADEAKGRIWELTPEELAYYNGGDAYYTRRLCNRFTPLQIEDNVRDVYENILIVGANALREIHERGAYIDPNAVKKLAREWLPRWLEMEKSLLSRAREMGWDGIDDINPGSWQQLGHFLYDICLIPRIGKGKQERSTAKPILNQFIEEYEDHPAAKWVRDLFEWRGLDRDINTYIRGVEDDKDEYGFIHTEPSIHGTRHGRLAYHNPPVQTIPKARTVGADRARIRRIFAAAPPCDCCGERVLAEADHRQAELWTAHFVSGDPNILLDLTTCVKCGEETEHLRSKLISRTTGSYMCDKGGEHEADYHARVAEANWGKKKEDCDPIEWEVLRDSAKITTYGINYGGGPSTLVGQKKNSGRGAGGEYKFIDTIKQAQEAINNWLLRYFIHAAWRKSEQKYVQENGEQISKTGRKRRYFMIQDYKALNQAINTPVSSLAHDFLFMSLIECHYALKKYDAYVLWEVHDSILFDIPKKWLKESLDIITEIMTKPRWEIKYGIPVDIKIGSNWYDVESEEKYFAKVA